MDENPGTASEAVGIYPRQSDYTVAETNSVEILVDLVNLTTSGDYFKLAVVNLPFAWVKFLPSQLVFLEHGEKKQIALNITLPLGSVGTYDLKILVTRKTDESQAGEAHIELSVTTAEAVSETTPVPETQEVTAAAFQSRGRVGVTLREVRFFVTPGEVLSIPVQLTNQSLEDERLTLVLQSKDILPGWVSVQPPFVELKAGKTQTLNLKIAPPRKYTSKAGRYPFVLEVRSARFADSPASVDCVLTVTAYSQSNIQVNPLQVFASQPMQVKVENAGNTAETFDVTWEGLDRNLLEFEILPPPPVLSTPAAPTQAIGMTRLHQPSTPGSAGMLRVEPGKTGVLHFKPTPKTSPILGRARRYSFQTKVTAADRQARLFSCLLTAQPIIPPWALVAFLIVCVFSFCALVWLVNQSGGKGAGQISSANTQTAVSLAQTAYANQTATAFGLIDSDGDGLTDIAEIGMGTNPALLDTDIDGLSDGDEVNNRKTDPKKADSDGDGLIDGDEINRGFNPLSADTDGDGLNDGDEVRIGSDPKAPDTDQDGLTDKAETSTCNTPTDPDTDDDGILDGQDLNPCDKNNPSLTQTALALIPTATPTYTSTPTPTTVPLTLTPTPVLPTLTPTPTVTPPAPRLPGILLFSSNREGRPQIYSRDMFIGGITRLTVSSGDDTQPSWSPDGSKVAFTSNRDGNHEIYVMDAIGANPINLTNNNADDAHPTWSPDGQWLAFNTNRDGNYDIYIMRSDGSELQNISNHLANDVQPFWGMTSGVFGGQEVILFVTDRDGNQEVYSMQPDGLSPHNLTNNNARDYLPALSPDGGRIAFTSERNGNPDIFVMDTDGSDSLNLTADSSAVDESPSWSGDNQWIAYSTTVTGNPEIFMTKSDGSLRYNITTIQADDRDPDWR